MLCEVLSMARRKAAFINLVTGETVKVTRGTKRFEQFKKRGYITKQQASHLSQEKLESRTQEQLAKPQYKKYREQYQPTETPPPEETDTDYPTITPDEIIRQRIDEMFERIDNSLRDIVNPATYFIHREPHPYDLTDTKQELISMLNDLVGQSENLVLLDSYLISIEPKVAEYSNAIQYDSQKEDIDYHISLLAQLLNHGNALSFEKASSLGNMNDFNGVPLGWHEQSSRLSEDLY